MQIQSNWAQGRNMVSEFRDEAPTRFSERARDYSLGRPSYPDEALSEIDGRLPSDLPRIAADIGAGTGSFTKLLLKKGFAVTAVEPSEEMRLECDSTCKAFPDYVSCAGTAESIPAADQSVSLITAAQAFHWFQPEPARIECLRVLRPGGIVAILWNNRDQTDALQTELTKLFSRYGGERFQSQRVGLERQADLDTFFGKSLQPIVFDYQQLLDEEAFVALGRSRSYMPKAGTPSDASATEDLRALHREFANDGLAAVRYQTHLYLDCLS